MGFKQLLVLALTVSSSRAGFLSSIHRVRSHNVVDNVKRDDNTQLFNFTGIEGVSTGCIQAMESLVSCSSDGMQLLNQVQGGSGLAAPAKLTADDLTMLCTSSCTDSLASMEQKVASACQNDALSLPTSNSTTYVPGTNVQDSIYGSSNETYMVSSALDLVLLNYRVGCLKDSAVSGSAAWCSLRFEEGITEKCDECELGTYRAQMEDAHSFDKELAAQYTSLVSSCGKLLTPIKTPTKSVFATSATATETQACMGTMVPVESDADCDDFARTHSIGTEQLLSLNGLTSGCVGFPGSKSSLCIEGSCKTYTVTANDTCTSISKAAGIKPIQFLTWNPMLGVQGCDKDIVRMVGHVVCIGNPLPYTPPGITGVSTTATSASTKSAIGFDQLETLSSIWTHEPLPTEASTTTTGAQPWKTPTFDLAEGSISDCYYMYDNEIDRLSCYAVASRYGVSEETWVGWNPSAAKGNISEPGNCYLDTDTRYCGLFWNPRLASTNNSTESPFAPKPADATEGATDLCFYWDKTPAESMDDLCNVFMDGWKITIDQLYAWNPAVGKDCRNLWLDTSYCVSAEDPSASTTSSAAPSTTTSGAPAPTRAGTVEGCQDWYVAQDGDGCGNVATQHGITLAQFVEWNSDVNPDNCDGFWPTYAYCIKGPATATATGKASSTTSVTPPGPTQPGISKNCNKYAVTEDNDGCEAFAQRYSISVQQLYDWNEALEGACKNFWAGEAYCIGVSS